MSNIHECSKGGNIHEPRTDIRRYQRSPDLQARWELARQEALEKLRHDAKPIYKFIRVECGKLSLSINPCDLFFRRQDKWWLRMPTMKMWGHENLRHLHDSHFKAALGWLVKEGYILQDNFDKDYCSTKWYAIGDKPFTDS